MRRQLMVAAIAAMVMAIVIAAGSPANAAQVTGRIRSINQFAHTATLDDGDTFNLANSVDATNLHVGELVKITYRGIGSGKRASTIEPLN